MNSRNHLIEDTFEIRNCLSEDHGAIQRIEWASFSDPYPPMVFLTLRLDPENIFLVATEKGVQEDKIVGYAVSKIEEDENKVYFGHLISFAVEPSFRRRGIGTRLLEDTISRIRRGRKRTRRIELEVRMGNRDAISLYERFGFVDESILLNYYGLNSHAYRMKLDLEPTT